MTEEKVLAFLKLSKDKKIDKTIMKILLWFDVGVLPILGIMFLTKVFPVSVFSIAFISSAIISDIVFFIWCKKAINPAHEVSFNCVLLASTVLKLSYGFVMFVKYGNTSWSWLHLIVLVLFIVLASVEIYTKRKEFKSPPNSSKEVIQKKKIKIIPYASVAGIAVSAVRLFRFSSAAKLSIMGHCLWFTLCAWIFFFCIYIHLYIIARKYKVAELFQMPPKE